MGEKEKDAAHLQFVRFYVKHGPGEVTQLRPFFQSPKLCIQKSGIMSNSY